MTDVSVIIVTWNGRQYLEAACARSRRSSGVDAEIVLVDNGSTDGTAGVRARAVSRRAAGRARRESRLRRRQQRRRARGARRATWRFSTTTPWPIRLAARASRGIDDSPRLRARRRRASSTCTTRRSSTAPATACSGGAARSSGITATAPRLRRSRMEVFGVCGAACLMPKAVFDELGGFDEDFFASHEDVDLSYRARLRGYRCRYVPDAIVRHHGSATLGTHQHVCGVPRPAQPGVDVPQEHARLAACCARCPGTWSTTPPRRRISRGWGCSARSSARKARRWRGLPAVMRKRAAIQRRGPRRRRRHRAAARPPVAGGEGARKAVRRRDSRSRRSDEPRRSAPSSSTTTPAVSWRWRCSRSPTSWRAGRGRPSSSTTPRRTAAPRPSTAFAPHARVVQNRENVGFARGVNQGLAATTAPMVLIMNPDCRLAPGRRRRAQRRTGARRTRRARRPANPQSGRIGPGQRARRPGHADRAVRTHDARCAGCCRTCRLEAQRRSATRPADGSIEVDWVSGACMLARRERSAARQRIRRALLSVLGRCRPVPAAARRRATRSATCRRRPRFTASAIRAAMCRSSAIRAFHESAYLYYSTHVAPTASPKRLAAKVLLAARCWLKLQQSRPSLN